MEKRTIGILAALLATFFWGTTFILVKKTVEMVPIDGFLTIRFFLATIFMYLLSLRSNENKMKYKNSNSTMFGVILGLLLYISYLFQTEGLALTTPSKAAFITGLSVIIIPPLGIFFFKKQLKMMEAAGTIIAFIGLILMTLNFADLSKVNIGDLLIIVTAITVALHILVVDSIGDIDITRVITIQFATITISSLILSIIRNSYWVPIEEPAIVWITLFVTAILASVYAFYAQIYAQNNGVSSTEIAIIFMFEPIFALLIDVILGSIPNLQVLLGMFFILVSMIVVTTR